MNMLMLTMMMAPSIWSVGSVNIYLSPLGNNSHSGTSSQSPLLTLARAVSVAQSGDAIYFAAGVYDNTCCNVNIALDEISLIGSSEDSGEAVIDCSTSTDGHMLRAAGSSVVLNRIVFEGGGSVRQAGIEILAQNVSVIGATVRNSRVVQSNPCGTNCALFGGGMLISPSNRASHMTVRIDGSTFLNNSIECSSGLCNGGGLFVRTFPDENYAAMINITASRFKSNTAVGRPTTSVAPGIQGGGLSITNAGAGSVSIYISNQSNFMSNSASLVGYSGGGSNPVPVIGGGINIENTNYAAGSIPYSDNLQMYIMQALFFENSAVATGCNSVVNDAANSGALAFSGQLLEVQDTNFTGNSARCLATPYARTTLSKVPTGGIGEGGAVFIQGLHSSQSPNLQPVLRFMNTNFQSNVASCTGPSCAAIGGAVQVTVAAAVEFTSVTCNANSASCSGSVCQATGGCVSIQNGPASTIGSASMIFSALDSQFISNEANATSGGPEYDGSARFSQLYGSFGAAISVISLFQGPNNEWGTSTANNTHVNTADCLFRDNAVLCHLSSSCEAFGADYGAWIAGGNVDSNLSSSDFAGTTIECQSCTNPPKFFPIGVRFSSQLGLEPIYNVATGMVSVGGTACKFPGTDVLPNNSSFLQISSECKSTSTSNMQKKNDGNGAEKLSVGDDVGIGIGVAVIVVLIAIVSIYVYVDRSSQNTKPTYAAIEA